MQTYAGIGSFSLLAGAASMPVTCFQKAASAHVTKRGRCRLMMIMRAGLLTPYAEFGGTLNRSSRALLLLCT